MNGISFEGVVAERWQWCATKHMYTDLVIHWLFPPIPILPPQKAKQVPMIVSYKNLEKHIYVCYKCNPFLSKSDQGTISLISEIRILLIDLPAYPVLQSKTTWILLGLAGWYTPCWGKYHTFSPVVYLWKSQHTMYKNFFHKFLVVMKVLSLM